MFYKNKFGLRVSVCRMWEQEILDSVLINLVILVLLYFVSNVIRDLV